MRSLIFAKRNAKEIIRDPLSYVFCLGFPVIMLIFFQIMTSSIIGTAEKRRDETVANAVTVLAGTLGTDQTTAKTAGDSYILLVQSGDKNPQSALSAVSDKDKMVLTDAGKAYSSSVFLADEALKGADSGISNFKINNNLPGVIFFGFSFVMLFLALLVSKDRTTTFLIRLYTSPMKQSDYVVGYMLPGIVLGVSQALVCLAFAAVIGAIRHEPLSLPGSALMIVAMLSVLPFFIGLGVLFGCILNDKSAPAVCSALVSASSILSGAFMPIATMGDAFEKVCYLLPFYSAVQLGRGALNSDFASYGIWWQNLLIPLAYSTVAIFLAVFIFGKKMNSDN